MAGGARLDLEITYYPAPAVIASAFFVAAARLADMGALLEEFATIAATEIDLNFAEQGRPEHWTPLAAATLQRRAFAGLSSDQRSSFRLGTTEFQAQVFSGLASGVSILEDTGALREGATSVGSWAFSTGGQKGVAEMMEPTPYGHFHITGTSKMPERDWTYISDQAIDEMEEMFAEMVNLD